MAKLAWGIASKLLKITNVYEPTHGLLRTLHVYR